MTKSSLIASALFLLMLNLAATRPAYAVEWNFNWSCDNDELTSFWEEPIMGNVLKGRGTVCKSPFGLESTMSVRNLTPGNAYTVWWVYIDDAAACADTPLPSPEAIPFPEPPNYAGRCGLADFFTLDPSAEFLNPLAVYGRMDSTIAELASKTKFTGKIRGLKPSAGSQVWMFIFGHGPAALSDKRQLARQLLTPEDPLSGVPHLGIEGRPFGYPSGVVVIDFP